MHDYYTTIQDKYNIQNVSRETIARLLEYKELLLEWNMSMNLIGKSTVETVWERHIIDSLQLINYLPNKNITITDLGSGAGLPGLILSFCGIENVYLIESDKRKANFLKEAAKISNKNIYIFNDRIEKINIDWKTNIITSRALAVLPKLLDLSYRYQSEDSSLLFPKGENFKIELEEAKENYTFEYSLHESITNKNSFIIKIDNLLKKRRK